MLFKASGIFSPSNNPMIKLPSPKALFPLMDKQFFKGAVCFRGPFRNPRCGMISR